MNTLVIRDRDTTKIYCISRTSLDYKAIDYAVGCVKSLYPGEWCIDDIIDKLMELDESFEIIADSEGFLELEL